jgi:uncharacterized membrane protein
MNLIKSHNTIEGDFKRSTWIGAVLLAVFSILAQYRLPVMSYGLILATIYGIIMLFQKGIIVFNKELIEDIKREINHDNIYQFILIDKK